MALKRKQLVVGMFAHEALNGDEGEFTITLTMGDQLRAELEGKKRGIVATQSPLHLQALFAWAALVREGLWSGDFASFGTACAYVDDPDRGDDGDDVDPTEQTASSDSV